METGDSKNKIIEIVKDLLTRLGFEAEVRLESSDSESHKFATISIESENDLSMLIGKNGQNLHAFEHLVRIMAAQRAASPGESFNFIIDVNDYRKSRTSYLISMAKEAAQRVAQTRRAEALLPMSSYERKIVHMELASYKDVQTESVGDEPRRRVVIKPQLGQL